MQTKNHGWFDAGPFNQKPSIKTTPAQCPAAATGFIKLILGLCAMQELPSRQATPNQRWPNVGSPSTTPDQRHTMMMWHMPVIYHFNLLCVFEIRICSLAMEIRPKSVFWSDLRRRAAPSDLQTSFSVQCEQKGNILPCKVEMQYLLNGKVNGYWRF